MIEIQSKSPLLSSITNLPFKPSSTDIMAYVEMLLIQDYDHQMASLAQNLKMGTRLKQSYREHKIRVNDLFKAEQDEGRLKLSLEQVDLLLSQPDYRFEAASPEGLGQVIEFFNEGEDRDSSDFKEAEEGYFWVPVDEVKAELDRLQMSLDRYNTETELAQTELSTLTSQRKLAFETMSSMMGKVFETSGTILRNLS